MIKFRKLSAFVCAGMIAVGMFSGCGQNETETEENTIVGDGTEAQTETETESDALDKIVIALDWTPNTNHTGIYAADALGYFEEEGITVEIIEALESGAEAVVAAGTAQFGISFQDYLVPLFSAEQADQVPITVVAAIIQHNTSGIISPKELGIESAKDLAGHSYATWDLPIEQAIMEKVVMDDGGNWAEVSLISQYVENIQGAFESGIDSVWIYYAWDGINTELAGVETNFFLFSDYGTELDYYSPVIIVNDDFLVSNQDLVKKFMKAVSKGYTYAMEHPDEAAEILVNANEGMDLELCKASQEWLADQYQADAARWGEIDTDRWDAFFTWVYENGLCEYEIPSGYGFTNDYLPE